jgi:anti-sigma factor RsiW
MKDGDRREERELHAYRDGELSAFGRWRVRRRIARDPRARRELASVAALGNLLREQASARAEPDLWEAVRAQLATAPRPAPLLEDEAPSAPGAWLPGCLGAALAAASVALLMAGGRLSGDAAPVGSLRWLDSKGKPVMVLQDDRDATIIWVLPKSRQADAGGSDAVV